MVVLHVTWKGHCWKVRTAETKDSFQYILSIVDLATRYLWLLPLHHKTAEAVVAALFDEVISRVSVPSAILMERG